MRTVRRYRWAKYLVYLNVCTNVVALIICWSQMLRGLTTNSLVVVVELLATWAIIAATGVSALRLMPLARVFKGIWLDE